jgi:hypothetical protein
MTVTESSLDDMHQAALAEFEAGGNTLAIALVNLLYADTRSKFYASLEQIRELTAEGAQ